LQIAESDSNRRHKEEIEKLKHKIEESESRFKKVKEIAKHDAEYELYQQRNELEKDHRTKYEVVQAQVIKLQEENEVFRSRENDFDIAKVKEELRVSEETLKKAREYGELHYNRARSLEETLNKQINEVKEEARNAVNRAREEHTIRLNAIRNTHEEQLTTLKAKTNSLKQDQELMVRRMQNENKRRMQEATKAARQEASRNITTARTEFEALAESKVTQMRALHRVEIQRLRRQLHQYKKSNGENVSEGDDDETNTMREDGTIVGLDGIEPSGIDLLNFQASRIASDVSSYGSSSGEDVPVDQMSLNDMKDHIIQLRQLLSRAQKTIKKERKLKKEVESALATAIREKNAAQRQARAWASASASGSTAAANNIPLKSVKFAPTGLPGANNTNDPARTVRIHRSGTVEILTGTTDDSRKHSSSSENGDVIEMDEDVTNKLFLSPQGTIEKRRKLQQEVANEDELTLPSQDNGDDGDNQKSDKPAVAKLDQYLKNHK